MATAAVKRLQQDQEEQLKRLIALLQGSGTSGGALQTLEEARQQAIADTKGLTTAAIRDFQASILPQITGGAESAGGSASALVALLSQKAAIDAAGAVAKQQGGQILGQEKIAQDALTAQSSDILRALSGLIFPIVDGGTSFAGIAPSTPTTLPSFDRKPLGGFHGPTRTESPVTPTPAGSTDLARHLVSLGG